MTKVNMNKDVVLAVIAVEKAIYDLYGDPLGIYDIGMKEILKVMNTTNRRVIEILYKDTKEILLDFPTSHIASILKKASDYFEGDLSKYFSV